MNEKESDEFSNTAVNYSVSDSEEEEEEGAYSGDEANQSEDEEGIDEYGPDLYKDEEDRRRLLALPEVERERILSERSEERQRNLERLEVRKLLKDGRREDSARRSTRAKGSGTARALSELTRRREEKHKSRSKRHSRESVSPERRKRRKSSYSGQSDYEYSGDEEDRSEEESTKAKMRAPTLEEIQSIALTRQMVEKWLYAPFFENTVPGLFVRLFIGPDPKDKTPVYRLCEVVEVASWHKAYKIAEGVWSKKGLRVRHGNAEKVFSMDIISNQPVSQKEFARYNQTLEMERVRGPTLDHVEQKREDIKHAREYVLNDKEVAQMIQNKRSVSGGSTNVAMQKAQLLVLLEHAKSHNEAENIERYTRELKELDERTSYGAGNDDTRQQIWADLNKRNREKDRAEALAVELKAAELRMKALLQSANQALKGQETSAATSDTTNILNAPEEKISYSQLVTRVAKEIPITFYE
ncbi:hypothetical protein EC973_007553 [Apophysomyces ossiformis]|uniref:Plus3 domain-containing protein n=1 Tax=Apophysomyces ossiformis TaxID=679940 RepID=A0A8H7BUH5_9FUNG|nr:hypothetical protein EC973_007553 [Apophysomyces ossiformis]